MTKRFKGKNAKVCVAVRFDEASKRAVQVAEQYCYRTGAELRLVHVCENVYTAEIAAISAGGMVVMPPEIFETAEENAKEDAKAKMFDLTQLVKAPIKVSTHILGVVPGSVAEAIEAEAISSRADLIFVGASPGSHRFIPRGFSCALSLMSHAKVPVMVVNVNQTSSLGGDRLAMVIADDLKSESNAAVVGGCELAFALAKTDIYHLYVNGVTEEALESALGSALAASRSQSDVSVSAKEVHQALLKQLQTKLENRTLGANVSLEMTACRYYRDILTKASVTDCLETYVKQKKADIVVFGRHHAFHRKPFSIGQMPYYAMLTLNASVLVFPTV